MEQGTKEWLELRRTKIGASDAGVILKMFPFGKTPFQLWEEKIYGKETETTEAMARGTALEPQARECFQSLTDILVMPKIIIHPTRQWQMASLDGISFDGTTIVEIKCPRSKETHRLAEEGEIPDYYMAQMQHQFAVSGAVKGYYFSYNGDRGALVEVFPDDKYIENLICEELKFYEFMIKKEAPPLTDRDYINQQENKSWKIKEQAWIDAHYALKKAEHEEEFRRKTLIESCNGKNCISENIKVTRSTCEGRINYAMIPEIIDMEPVYLDLYRKPPCEKWRLSVITKEEI